MESGSTVSWNGVGWEDDFSKNHRKYGGDVYEKIASIRTFAVLLF